MDTPPTLCVVDDDEAIRNSLKLLLEASGFKVEVFPSGAAFLEALTPSLHGCAIIDVRMPTIGGLEVQEELRRRAIDLPVIVMTGHADVPLAVRAMRAGATDFVEKPFSDDTILASIERALERDRQIRDAQAAMASVHDRVQLLTAREREVLNELVAGHPNKVIAFRLSISPRTVEIHRARVMEKMQARSLSELVRMALKMEPRPASQ